MSAARRIAAARRRLPQRHDGNRIIRVTEPACALARSAATRPFQHHRQEQSRLDDAFAANLAAQNEIVALEKTARRFQPLCVFGEIIRDRTVIGTDDTEPLEHVFVDVRHHGWSKVIMLQVCNSHRLRSRLRPRFSLEGLKVRSSQLIGVDLKQLRRKADRRRDRRLEVSKRSIKPVAWAAVHDVTSECRTAWASWRPDLVEALTSGSSVVDLICSMVNIDDTSWRSPTERARFGTHSASNATTQHPIFH